MQMLQDIERQLW